MRHVKWIWNSFSWIEIKIWFSFPFCLPFFLSEKRRCVFLQQIKHQLFYLWCSHWPFETLFRGLKADALGDPIAVTHLLKLLNKTKNTEEEILASQIETSGPIWSRMEAVNALVRMVALHQTNQSVFQILSSQPIT